MAWDDELRASFDALPGWGRALVGGAVAVSTSVAVYYLARRGRKSPLKEDYKQDVVYVYQSPRTKLLPTPSNYCLKLETWLRMADINYENVASPFGTVSKEGTVPFVELNGEELDDSAFIIRDLSKIFKVSLEDHLNDEQRAASRAFEKLAEYSLNNSYQVFRAENVNALVSILSDGAFGLFTPLLTLYFKHVYPAKILSTLYAIGIGRHTRDEQIRIGSDDLRAISQFLGSKHYLTGFKPTRVDATLFGVLAPILYLPIESDHKNLIKNELKNIEEYVERIKTRYWADWEEITTTFKLNTNWKKKRADSPKRKTPS